MSNYTKATNFASKDSLLTGNPSKIVKGTEIDNEFNAISTAISTKFDTASLAAPGPIGATTPAAINGTTGTFTGAVSGTTGTFSGDVQMPSLNGGAISLRNKIINGSFTVNQRGWSSATPTTGEFTADRWTSICTVASKYSLNVGAAGSVAITAGAYGGGVIITSLSAYSVGAADSFAQIQRIEGYNVADLAWGTASAKTVTLSFIVISSLTGTFGGSIKNGANTRSYPFTYSIPVAGTHTKISITIPGDTTGATTDWLTTNGNGMNVVFGLGVGSSLSGPAGAWAAANYNSATGAVSVVGTNAATWTLFNVQLEVGSVATPFEQRPYGMELALCQRYYYRTGTSGRTGAGYCSTTTVADIYVQFPVSMRIAPTALEQSGTASQYGVAFLASGAAQSSVPAFIANGASINGADYSATVASGFTAGQACMGYLSGGYLGWSAEL